MKFHRCPAGWLRNDVQYSSSGCKRAEQSQQRKMRRFQRCDTETAMREPVQVEIAPSEHVTAIVYPAAAGDRAGISLILAHGAGANQMSAFMVQFAKALAARGIDTVTFNFLYSELRKRVPDKNDKLEACWRRMIEAHRDGIFGQQLTGNKLFIGGKS